MRTRPLEERLWEKIEIPDRVGCWVWRGCVRPDGYGVIGKEGGRGAGLYRVHRLVYELKVGPIPDGMSIDHLCKNTVCVNPDHLQPVPPGENTWRAFLLHAYCPKGHVLPPKPERGKRRQQCRECKRDYDAQYYAEGRKK